LVADSVALKRYRAHRARSTFAAFHILVTNEEHDMNIQIFGLQKCADTRKAQRFFKERGIRFQFVDLKEKGLSKGELRSVADRVPLDQLLDRSSAHFLERGLKHASLNAAKIEAVLLDDPLLFRTPIVRNGKEATVGYCPEVWKTWQASDK